MSSILSLCLMSSELLKRIVASIEGTFGISGGIDGCLDEVAIRKLLIDTIKHLLVTTLLLIDLISKVHIALVVLVHAVLVATIQSLITFRLII